MLAGDTNRDLDTLQSISFLKERFEVKRGLEAFRIKIQTLDMPAMFIVPC